MSRAKKLIINLILIVICLMAIYHFGGFYISKDQCVKEQLRGIHVNLEEPATTIKEGNMVYTIFVNDETYKVKDDSGSNRGHLVVVTQKIGFLYRAKSYQEMTGDEHNVNVSWFKTPDEKGYIVVAERKDDSIARADVLMLLGFTDTVQVKFEHWENNVAASYVEGELMNFGTYQTYDEAGNLIEDLWGDGVGIAQ